MIELQDSAYPFHDWNERTTAECYAPNSVARVLDADGRILRLVNNYSRISFDFGPTLLPWIEHNAPDVYQRVLDADRESQKFFAGHGSAMAQVYNHIIMPLANDDDRRTQVDWGIRDFRHRFGREPEGIWLAETAVDIPTLEVLAEYGVRFTVLAPHQAARVRKVGSEEWTDVSGAKIDPSVPYVQKLPSGRSLALFFYDGPVSQAVAFEKLLTRGESLAGRLISAFSDLREGDQLVHIATDGESYGHHHPHGDMALAYALEHLAATPEITLTNYGEFLENHPPQWEVEIFENSSWSCVHGVERWRSQLRLQLGPSGLASGTGAGPCELPSIGSATVDAPCSSSMPESCSRILGPLVTNTSRSFSTGLPKQSTPGSRDTRGERSPAPSASQAIKLLEMQRHALLMYTSCGWFFDEISGLETVQILQYACEDDPACRGDVRRRAWSPRFWNSCPSLPAISLTFTRPGAKSTRSS